MQTLTRDQVRQRLDEEPNTALVDVLSAESYQEYHLPGALNVPLNEEFDGRIQHLVADKDRPVIVYCKSTECQASPKAARRMEELGYKKVYDYEAGKEDWRQAGLPTEGNESTR